VIDIHSHILPGLDDGSQTLEQSVEMLRLAGAAGTTDIVASPHANHQFTFDPDVVEAKIAEVQAAAGDEVLIHYGCDFQLTPENIQDALSHPRKYSINHRSYLLVEFSDLMIPRQTEEIFAGMMSVGIRPVVTHPERNPLLQKRLPDLMQWVGQGALLQVTALSFTGRFGRQAQSFGRELMKRGLVHVIASDAHDTRHRPPAMDGIARGLTREYGAEAVRVTMEENPRAILAGVALPVGPTQAVSRRSWYRRIFDRSV